jgi:hypothetical protein
MKYIPESLAAQFTFHLTYCIGLTVELVALLHSSFQRGIGPHPFAEMIRTFHIRNHEQLHLQYLEMVLVRTQATAPGTPVLHQPFGAWDDPDGFAGFVPSGFYFREFYDDLLKRRAVQMDEHMATVREWSARCGGVNIFEKVCSYSMKWLNVANADVVASCQSILKYSTRAGLSTGTGIRLSRTSMTIAISRTYSSGRHQRSFALFRTYYPLHPMLEFP